MAGGGEGGGAAFLFHLFWIVTCYIGDRDTLHIDMREKLYIGIYRKCMAARRAATGQPATLPHAMHVHPPSTHKLSGRAGRQCAWGKAKCVCANHTWPTVRQVRVVAGGRQVVAAVRAGIGRWQAGGGKGAVRQVAGGRQVGRWEWWAGRWQAQQRNFSLYTHKIFG